MTWPPPIVRQDRTSIEIRWMYPPLLRAVMIHVFYNDKDPTRYNPDEICIGYTTLDGEICLLDSLTPEGNTDLSYSSRKLKHAMRWLIGEEDSPSMEEDLINDD